MLEPHPPDQTGDNSSRSGFRKILKLANQAVYTESLLTTTSTYLMNFASCSVQDNSISHWRLSICRLRSDNQSFPVMEPVSLFLTGDLPQASRCLYIRLAIVTQPNLNRTVIHKYKGPQELCLPSDCIHQ